MVFFNILKKLFRLNNKVNIKVLYNELIFRYIKNYKKLYILMV